MGEPNVRGSRRINGGGTLPGVDVAVAESTASIELAGAAEKAAAANPDASVPRVRGKLRADVKAAARTLTGGECRHEGSLRGGAAVDPKDCHEETQRRGGLATLMKSIAPERLKA